MIALLLQLPLMCAAEGFLTSFKNRPPKEVTLFLSVSIGTDIGGAMPIPLNAVGNQMQATPNIQAYLGARAGINFTEHFSTITEVNYKTVELEAYARVENQKATLDGITQYFTGTVRSHMKFTMLEIPLILKYRFGNSPHGVLFGGYGVWLPSATFLNSPMKGFLGSVPDVIEPGGTIDAPAEHTNMEFSPYLKNWDAGLLIGYENSILSRCNLSFRLYMGLTDIFKKGSNPLEYGMYQMRGSVSLSYDLYHLKKKKPAVVTP